MSKETYVTFEQAKALKRLGFDWECATRFYVDGKRKILAEVPFTEKKNFNSDGWYITVCSAPALHIAAKWLREVKGLAVNVIAHDGGMYEFDIVFLPNAEDIEGYLDRSPFCETYEEALSEGITVVIKYLEELQ